MRVYWGSMTAINGFEVNPIGIGTWTIGEGSNDAGEVEAIRFSLESGQNHIDTAEMYASGRAELLVGQAIKGRDRSKIFIASKIWRNHASRNAVVSATREMLKRLKTDYLDLL